MGTGPLMTTTGAHPEATASGPASRWRSWRLAILLLVVLAVVAGIGAYLTTPRLGDRMDPESTQPDGAHALVTLLRQGGVEVVAADTISDVEHAARADTLILVAQSQYLTDDTLLDRLAKAPGDLLLVEPTARTREALMPGMRISPASNFDSDPNCTLREATRAGSVRFGPSNTYHSTDSRTVTSCYDGVLIRYRDGGRTITVVGSTDFMTNDGLLQAGNAALAMNLAGDRPRVIWYAPHRVEGETSSASTITDLIPDNVVWVVWQLWLVVLLIALWKGRRPGPLVAEQLPVVVRASETVEGRGRLYRSRRARDRAADALRTATLQRLLPRLGLGPQAQPQAVVATVARRSGADAGFVSYHLFGPPPATDNDLLQLARALDDIERQVTHS
ncbi:membrane protein [Mycobacterium numidiamassiliense]|uniref:Membrane protein n=1 Tax=Mycobacterium numidiamassiliense TaxID=1841861 RepID=A0A2U3P870_9MYCO|nr:membrane protein [Mycobacterium numidiamassiliense]